MTFSEQVSKYRRAAKMTQEELAEKVQLEGWQLPLMMHMLIEHY